MEKLNKLAELAKELGGESWGYRRTTPYSRGYITGHCGRTIVQTTSGEVPANVCNFIEAADPETVLAIAEAYQVMDQRAKTAEAKLAELERQPPAGTAWIDCTTRGTNYEFRPMGEVLNGQELFTRPTPAESLAPVSNCLSFFASVIKCGESWSATCQRELDAARTILSNIEEKAK